MPKSMMKEEIYSGLTWTTEEMKNELRQMNKIAQEQDFDALFSLKDNSDFSITLHEILKNRYQNSKNALSSTQLNLFLCMHLENAGQADDIFCFLQDWFPNYSTEIVRALNEIGAIKSAELIKQAIEMLPENGSSFYDVADESSQALMSKLDSEFANYPDGSMPDLYRKYAENNRNEFF